jgi:hypothetical protein
MYPSATAMPNIAPSTTLACRIVLAERPASTSAVMKLRATVRSVSAIRQSPRNGTTCSRSVSA